MYSTVGSYVEELNPIWASDTAVRWESSALPPGYTIIKVLQEESSFSDVKRKFANLNPLIVTFIIKYKHLLCLLMCD